MHRHAVGDRRTPRGVGARVEVGLEVESDQQAVSCRAGASADAGGMRLVVLMIDSVARVGHAHRTVEMPRRDREERLDGQVELGAEAASDRSRD